MIPEAKAKALTTQMAIQVSEFLTPAAVLRGKMCAIVCCEQIIELLLKNKNWPDRPDYYSEQITYWQDVKSEVSKIDVHASVKKGGIL